jgi:antitoxin (DNA-binding transcriptional repressor) of toxin-antitoxin stability system
VTSRHTIGIVNAVAQGSKQPTMSTVTLEDAQARLPELIEQLGPGEEVIITRGDQSVARLVGQAPAVRPPRRLGTMQGTVLYVAPDFDAPLDDFEEYMK